MKRKHAKANRPRRTRPKILIAALLFGFAVFGVLGIGMARGDVPIQMGISGQNFDATISKMGGSNVAVYPRTVETTKNGRVETVVVVMGNAQIDDLCMAMSAPNLPVVGTVTMLIKAPGPSTKATNMMMDLDGLNANMTLDKVVVGASQPARDAASSEEATAIAAPSASILDVDAKVLAMRAESLSVSGAKVSIKRGEGGCS